MRRNLVLVLAAALLVPLLPMLTSGAAQAAPFAVTSAETVHPRLLFDSDGAAELRERIAVPGSVHAAAWQRLQEKADGHLIRVQPEVVRADVGVPVELQGLQKPYLLQGEMTSYLLELGMAYQMSEDPKYARHAIELLRALGDAGWPFWTGGADLGIGDLNMGVGLAFDWTYPEMTAEERSEIVASITAHQDTLLVRSMFEYTNEASEYRTSNWVGVLGGGTGLLLLAIRGEPEAPSGFDSPEGPAIPNRPAGTVWPARHYTFDDYLDKAVVKAGNYFRYGFDALGGGHEGHTYANYGLNRAVPFALAAQRAGVADILTGTGAPHIARWRSFEQLPGEGQNFVPINDSARTAGTVDFEAMMFGIAPDNGIAQWNWRRTVGEFGADYYNDPYFPAPVADEACPVDRWDEAPLVSAACPALLHTAHVWSILFYRTPEETPEVDPATVGPLSVHYDENGLIDARTGFAGRPGDPTGGVNETVSTFQAMRQARTSHFQYDYGNFTLYGEGGRWAIDPGSACVSCGHAYGAGPVEGYPTFHNVIVIDDSQLTQSHLSRYYDGVTIDNFLDAPNVSLTHADMRYAYSQNPNVSFDPPFAGRDHLFSRVPGRPVVVGIADELERDAIPFPRRYQWQMITDRANLPSADGSGFTIKAPNGATLVGRSARDANPTTSSQSAADPTFKVESIFFGNATDDYGPQYKISTETAPQQKLEQVTVMALTPAGSEPATTSVLRLNGANAVAVDWEGTREVFLRRVRSASAVTGEVQTDAQIARFIQDQGETVLRAGRSLSAYGRSYVTVTGSAATVAVSGDTAQATGAAKNVYQVYAPQGISRVTVNGAPTTSCRSGDYLTFPCLAPTQLALTTPASAVSTDPVSLAAVLTSEGAPLAGRTVTFTVGGLQQAAVTDSTGRAHVSLPLDLDPGSYTATVSFAVAGGYAASTATAPLEVVADETALLYTGDTAARGESVQASAVLTEDDDIPLAGRSVAFTLQERTVTAVTDADGRAAAILPAPDHGRSQIVTVDYAGETRYAPSATSRTITWGGSVE